MGFSGCNLNWNLANLVVHEKAPQVAARAATSLLR